MHFPSAAVDLRNAAVCGVVLAQLGIRRLLRTILLTQSYILHPAVELFHFVFMDQPHP